MKRREVAGEVTVRGEGLFPKTVEVAWYPWDDTQVHVWPAVKASQLHALVWDIARAKGRAVVVWFVRQKGRERRSRKYVIGKVPVETIVKQGAGR